jgi:translation initiation factor IF-2
MTRLSLLAGIAALAAACQGGSSGAPPPASATAPPPGPGPAPGPGPGPTPGPAPAASAAQPPGTVTVAQMAGMMPGSQATVRGLYLGWRGPCAGSPPTRSAWQLADSDQPGAACLFVDGPTPSGTNPAEGQPIWVRVDGRLDAAGPDRYLSARRVEREP